MARLERLQIAVLVFVCLGAVLVATVPAAAQTEEEARDKERFARIMASTDSLGFGSTASDSLQEVPVIVDRRNGLSGLIERSPIGRTGAGELFLKGGPTRRLIGRVITTLRNEGVQAAAEECQKVRGPIAAILYSGLQKADRGSEAVEKAISTAGTIEMAFLERGLIWIASVTTIAPLIGFLGTVSGMIRAFEAIAAAEQVNAKLVASGLSEALITTATGLIVAIPATIGYNYFVSSIDRFVIEMEETSAELIEELERQKQ
jgi:biopolymer transport protein ExbB